MGPPKQILAKPSVFSTPQQRGAKAKAGAGMGKGAKGGAMVKPFKVLEVEKDTHKVRKFFIVI